MVRVAKPGVWVVLGHRQNEAENQGYAGLHQWNFTAEADDFVIHRHRERINVTEALRDFGTV